MLADYARPEDACNDILTNLRRDFPDAVFELTYHVRGQEHAQHHIGRPHGLDVVLHRYLDNFPGMRVFYTPHHPYGMVCVAECWCDSCQTSNGECACSERGNHSCLAIIVHSQHNTDTLIGRCKPPEGTPHPWRAEEYHHP
jgi:hypothetical protein